MGGWPQGRGWVRRGQREDGRGLPDHTEAWAGGERWRQTPGLKTPALWTHKGRGCPEIPHKWRGVDFPGPECKTMQTCTLPGHMAVPSVPHRAGKETADFVSRPFIVRAEVKHKEMVLFCQFEWELLPVTFR